MIAISHELSVLEAAHKCVTRGLSVFPLWGISNGVCACKSPDCNASMTGKHPCHKGWNTNAAATAHAVDHMFKNAPHLNFAIATGLEIGASGKGLLVIDIDSYKEGADDYFDALITAHGALPDTVEVHTGGGGRHLYFMAPLGLRFAQKLGHDGIDIKGLGGYVVGPGSMHRSGKPYVTEASSDLFEDHPIALLPDWIVEKYGKSEQKQAANLQVPKNNIQADRWDLSRTEVLSIRHDLSAISANCSRAEWLEILMALHSRSTSLQMLDLADEWSQGSPEKYDAYAVRAAWNSFTNDGGITLATLANRARLERVIGIDITKLLQNLNTMPITKEPMATIGKSTFSLRECTANRLFIGKPKPMTWLVEGIFPQGKAIILASPPGVGKSFMSLNLALAVASAPSALNPAFCFGGRVKSHGRVVIVSAEDDYEELHRRMEALTNFMPERLHVVSLPDTGHFSFLQGDPRSGLVPTKHWSTLKNQIEELDDVRLVIVDTLQALSCGDLNAAEVAQAMMNELTELANKTGASVIALHHLTKGLADGQKGMLSAQSAMDAIRGSGAIVGAVRAAYCLFPHPDGKKVCEALDIPFAESKVAYGLVVKANGPARRDRSIYVRTESGLLVDMTMQYLRAIGEEHSFLGQELCGEILKAHSEGNGFAVSIKSKNGLHQRRYELPKQFHNKTAAWFEEAAKRLIQDGHVTEKRITNGAQYAPAAPQEAAEMRNDVMPGNAQSIAAFT